jgi:hypothetical protein
MDINGTGSQYSTLMSGTTDNPTLTQGAATAFSCNTVPDRCPTAPLAYYLPYAVLTISGTVVQPATSGSAIQWDTLRACLIESVDWIQTFFGSICAAQHMKGSTLPVVEFVTGGGQFALPTREPIPAAAGTYPFELSVAIPAGSLAMGDSISNTSNLALLFQTSTIKINVAGAGVLTSVSTGATFGALTARCSAKMMPSAELIFGTPIEWIRTELVAGAGSQITLKNLGTDTALNGFEQNKGGVAWLGMMTNLGLYGGSFAAQNVTAFQFEWGGQPLSNHPQAFISDIWRTLPVSRPQAFPANISTGDAQNNSYPYANGTNNQPTTTSTLLDLKGLAFWPLRQPARDFNLTDVQTADGDKNVYLTVTGNRAGTDVILGGFARQTTQGLRDKWLGQVIKGGDNSLAAYVLGPKYMDAVSRVNPDGSKGLRQRIPNKRHQTTADQLTYAPYQLAF